MSTFNGTSSYPIDMARELTASADDALEALVAKATAVHEADIAATYPGVETGEITALVLLKRDGLLQVWPTQSGPIPDGELIAVQTSALIIDPAEEQP